MFGNYLLLIRLVNGSQCAVLWHQYETIFIGLSNPSQINGLSMWKDFLGWFKVTKSKLSELFQSIRYSITSRLISPIFECIIGMKQMNSIIRYIFSLSLSLRVLVFAFHLNLW